jgi:Rieske Fe-S protein
MQRRSFFRGLSLFLSAAYVMFLAVPGVGLLVEPLKRQAGRGKRRRLARLSELEIGVPRRVVITDRRTDAWTRYPPGPIGAVWVVRRAEREVDIFTDVCPHLGCPVEHQGAEKQFFCPCHGGTFSESGEMVAGPQQRGLDRLGSSIESSGGEDWVSVVYQRFETGRSEKVPLG